MSETKKKTVQVSFPADAEIKEYKAMTLNEHSFIFPKGSNLIVRTRFDVSEIKNTTYVISSNNCVERGLKKNVKGIVDFVQFDLRQLKQRAIRYSHFGYTEYDEGLLKEIIEDEITFIEMSGDAWSHLGINDGDKLLVRRTSEINEEQLTAWDVGDDCLLIGFGYDNFGEISIQRMSGIERYSKRKARLIGVVENVMKPFDARKFSAARLVEEKTLSVTCAGCGKTETGSREFLQAMAWRIKTDKAECPACW